MGRKIAAFSIAAWISMMAFAPWAEACGGCRRGNRGGGKYVTYNGSSFQTYNMAYAPQAAPVQTPMASPYPTYSPMNPSYTPYAPAMPGGGFPPPPPPMMGY